MSGDQEWRTQAKCVGENPELWFAQTGTPEAQQAKRICITCPVRLECDLYANNTHQTYGIWAGQNLDRTIGDRTHCTHGHAFTADNTLYEMKHNRREYRVCRECKRLKDQARHAKERASA